MFTKVYRFFTGFKSAIKHYLQCPVRGRIYNAPLYLHEHARFIRKWAYFCLSESPKSFAQKGLKNSIFFANSKIVSLHLIRF